MLQAEVDSLKEQLATVVAENKRKLEDALKVEEQKREALKDALREEFKEQMQAMLVKQREDDLQHVRNSYFVNIHHDLVYCMALILFVSSLFLYAD